jgi:hypothetical protein
MWLGVWTIQFEDLLFCSGRILADFEGPSGTKLELAKDSNLEDADEAHTWKITTKAWQNV